MGDVVKIFVAGMQREVDGVLLYDSIIELILCIHYILFRPMVLIILNRGKLV